MNNNFKTQFEDSTRYYLPKKAYTIIRLDGKAFSSFTKRFKQPFDDKFITIMNDTALRLCEEVAGVKMAYVQSDEISLIISDLDSEKTQLWFDGNIQKIASVSASIATAHFNKYLMAVIFDSTKNDSEKIISAYAHFADCLANSLAYFDSRVFSVPTLDKVYEYLALRQKDAIKNSISMQAQSLYSHKELHNKNSKDKIEMCIQKNNDWNSLPIGQQRGRIVVKQQINKKAYNPITKNEEITMRHEWKYNDCPFFIKDKESLDKIFT